MFRNTRNGAWYFDFFRACFNFVSKHFETNETFGLSQFSSCFSPFQFFPYIIHCFSVSKHQKWGWYFHLFKSLFQFCFETTETFGLSQFSSCFSLFQFFPYTIHCFSVLKHQKWGLVFSPFLELVSILVLKCFETTETFGLSQFSSCFSLFQFFPYIIHCFSVSKHQKWGWYFHLFQSLFQFCFETFRNNWTIGQSIFFLFQSVSIFSLYNPLFQCFETPEIGPGIFTFFRACFNFVLKQLKHLDLVNFLPVSVRFNFFPI